MNQLKKIKMEKLHCKQENLKKMNNIWLSVFCSNCSSKLGFVEKDENIQEGFCFCLNIH